MPLQLAHIFLPLLFLLCLHMGATEKTAAVIVVNQTPPYICAMEGSEFTIKCRVNVSTNLNKWFVEWKITRNNVTKPVNGTDRIISSKDEEKIFYLLTVKKADVNDSGTYVCYGGSKEGISPGSGTQVTIDEITDLMVNQTPANFSDLEGSELTMNCTFNTVSNHTTMHVRWYHNGMEGQKKELANEHNVVIIPHLENGFATLTLKNVNSSNTGTYMCEVGITGRNLSGNAKGTEVTIKKITNLMVNQTPANIHKSEGSDLSMECRFMVLKKPNNMYVKWYKHNGSEGMKKELMSERDRNSTALNLEKGFSSLTLKKVNVTNTGTYVCEVGISARNLSMSGNGTQVTITVIDLLVYQTPAFVSEEEGKELTIICRFRVLENASTQYSAKWYKNETGGHEEELKNGTGSVTTALDSSKGLASLTLVKVTMNDSGLYRCDFGKNGRGNGTRVTIHAVDLLVNQTLAIMTGLEGKNLTIECRFKVVNDSSATYSVKWYKNGTEGHVEELKNGTGRVTTALDSSKGQASLTLIKTNRNDSGLYICDFGNNGHGNGTRVTIHAPPPRPIILYVTIGAVVGTLFLLVLGICLWRWRQNSKGTLQSRPEAEMNQMERSSPQSEDVTYADLNFHKRDVKAAEEVVYTEVKTQPKQRVDNAIYAKINTCPRKGN